MTYLSMQHIPLASAYLCQDCDSIGNNSSFCPACASTALMGLSGILDRNLVLEERRFTPFAYPKPPGGVPVVSSMVA
jgi:hypothetical protein